MRFRRTTCYLFFALLTSVLLFACGGGGGGSAAPAAPQAPSATTMGASPVTTSNATLNGTVNPNGTATTAWFEWGADNTLANPTSTSSQSVGSGSADNVISQAITGLTSGTTYYFRVVASSSAGTVKGSIVACTTAAPLAPPAAQTFAATSISIVGATLNGTVIPNGLATDAWFVWGTDPTLVNPSTTHTTVHQAKGSGMTDVAVSESLTGLTAATTYYFKLVAQNTVGTANGEIGSFNTNTVAPTVATNPATSITVSGATLNGSVNPNGLATAAWFEWGTDSNLGTFDNTTAQNIGSALTDQPILAALPGLTVGTTYYFRAAASNSGGVTKGTIRSFNTVNPPPVANAGPDQTVYMDQEVTLDGSASADNPPGPSLTYLWEKTAGPDVTLDNTASPTPTFTFPPFSYDPADKNLQFKLTVTNDRGLSATDNVNVTVKWGFFDDFSANSTGYYVQFPASSLLYDAGGKRARILAGAGETKIFSSQILLPDFRTNAGVFSIDFNPTGFNSGSKYFTIRLIDGGTTYYEFSTQSASLRKVWDNTVVDSVAFPHPFFEGQVYPVSITFDQFGISVSAFGQTASMVTTNTNLLTVSYFEIWTSEMNAYYDNIKLGAKP